MADFGITPELVAHVKEQERWVPHPYKDPVGIPTLGWGHRIPSMDHPPISLAEGEALLADDLKTYRDAVLSFSPHLTREPERRLAALTDFAFNCGPAAYGKSRLRREVDACNWGQAATEMRRWVWATDQATHQRVKLEGLVKRRAVTAKWLEA